MTIDKEALMQFYKSPGHNYKAFQQAKVQRGQRDVTTPPTKDKVSAPPADKGNSTMTLPHVRGASTVPTKDITPAAPKVSAPLPDKAITATQVRDVTSVPTKDTTSKVSAPPADKGFSTMTSTQGGADSASQEYILYLKQQQQLQKTHQQLEDLLVKFAKDSEAQQAEINDLRAQAAVILKEMETGENWNLQSKYNVNTLIKEANLQLQPRELYNLDMSPNCLDIQQQESNLAKLRTDHQLREAYQAFKSLLENGARRLDRVETELKNSQLDGTAMARLPDALLVQLDHTMSIPTIHEVLQEGEEMIEDSLGQLEETKERRDQSMEDGEMMLAERHTYDVVNIYEHLLELELTKIRTVADSKHKQEDFDRVRNEYQLKGQEEVSRLRQDKEELKKRCEDDMGRIFKLKEHVDALEVQIRKKLETERRVSDNKLEENQAKMDDLWARIQQLEVELAKLERERYEEVKRRVQDKDKDENRRMEYERFNAVVEQHTALLNLTVKNCDTAIYCITLLGEFLNNGFKSLNQYLTKQVDEHDRLSLETHKQHLELFRGLYLTLGDLVHRKEKTIDDIDSKIKDSHIQQEMASETFNPNAKMFSDKKKELLRLRDEVEEEVRCLKERAQVALQNFRISENALNAAGVDFVHPVVEQQDQELETRAKMVEYKALALGHVDALPLQAELEEIKYKMSATKRAVDMLHASAIAPR